MKTLIRTILFCYIVNSFIFAQTKDSITALGMNYLKYIRTERTVRNNFIEENWDDGNKIQLKNNILSQNIDYRILGGAGLLFLGTGTYLHNVQSNAWWSKSGRFHSIDEFKDLFSFNKINHFYGVNLLGHLFSGGYEASGMQALESTWFSSLTAFSYVLYIEFEDAYHQGQGFSYSELGADILGTAYYIGQYYIPGLKSFQPKISYKLTDGLKKGNAVIFDDYAGQKYWIAIRAKEFIPMEIGKYWPSFLNVALGTGFQNGQPGKLSGIYLAFDLDAEEIPLYGPFWQFVKNTLNYFHFPMPGVRITPKATTFLLCF